MSEKVESIKYLKDKRIHIPSKEEAGYEEANLKVQKGKKAIELPKNPVVHRGQDPELFWMHKYNRDKEIAELLKNLKEESSKEKLQEGVIKLYDLLQNQTTDDRDELLRVDIRSLYRHEHIAPETLIKNLYRICHAERRKAYQLKLFDVNKLFGNALEKDELLKVSEYYQHQDGWTNRLIQGDSLLVMASMLEREGMAGQVQTIFVDPPYGINYNKNWQLNINDKNFGSEAQDDGLSGEPEMIKAFRDTWELGIHSYLTYLRDRLLVAKELLTESGSCFVQISEENVHLVRSVMEEVFGSENFISQISFRKKTMPLGND